jgi:hypothetical protein
MLPKKKVFLHFDSEIMDDKNRSPLGISRAEVVRYAIKRSENPDTRGANPNEVQVFGVCWLSNGSKKEEAFHKFLQGVSGKVVVIYGENDDSRERLCERVAEAKQAGAVSSCVIVNKSSYKPKIVS